MQNTAYRFYRQVQENTAAKCRRKSHRRPAAAAAAAAKRPSRPLARGARSLCGGSARQARCASAGPRSSPAFVTPAAPRASAPSAARSRSAARRTSSPGIPLTLQVHAGYIEFCRRVLRGCALQELSGVRPQQAAQAARGQLRQEPGAPPSLEPPAAATTPRRRAAAPLRRRAAPTAYSVTPPQPTAPRPRLALTACACVYRATSTTIL